ncbi:MAG: helix-turn-helix domain-containing protein [Chloroflexi bacterium]|nr:helix-turn-helix domain-containing protein [Chloroflexota bacterium]
MSSLGTRLREAREGRGLTLQQVEEQLRIRHQFLSALEEERFDALPGDVYTRGFLQNYARFLGLPVEEIVEQYSGSSEVPRSLTRIPTVLDEPLLSSTSRPVWPGIFLGLMLLLVLLVAGWFGYARLVLHENPLDALRSYGIALDLFNRRGAGVATGPTTGSPARPTETATPTEAQPASGAGEATAVPPLPTATATHVSAVATPTPRRTMTPTATATATTEPSAEPVAEGTPPPADAVTVVAKVVQTTWLSVTIDGAQVLAATLDPGEEYTWVGRQSVALRIGNAAGLELVVNGQALEPLGASGEVVDVTYTPAAAP